MIKINFTLTKLSRKDEWTFYWSIFGVQPQEIILKKLLILFLNYISTGIFPKENSDFLNVRWIHSKNFMKQQLKFWNMLRMIASGSGQAWRLENYMKNWEEYGKLQNILC